MPRASFVPTTSFRPKRGAASAAGRFGSWRAMDARHGRVLICRSHPSILGQHVLSIWNPVTDELRDLPDPPFRMDVGYSNLRTNAAMACAAAGGNCDHPTHCHGGHFLVVVMEMSTAEMRVSIYSSDAAAWSKATVFQRATPNSLSIFKPAPSVLVSSEARSTFLLHFDDEILNDEIMEYDLAARQVSMIPLPYRVRRLKRSIVLMTDGYGGLGFAANVKDKLELWSREDGDDAGFVLTRVIDLRKLLPSGAVIKNTTQVNGFADGGGASRFLFIRMSDGLYSIDINSSQLRKVHDCCDNKDVVPYISFCTPTSRRVQN